MKSKRNGNRAERNSVSSKDRHLERFREHPAETALTTDQGVRMHHTDDSLKAGQRGPTLLEDFHLREKITRFDHERIPERVVHARGTAAQHRHWGRAEAARPVPEASRPRGRLRSA